MGQLQDLGQFEIQMGGNGQHGIHLWGQRLRCGLDERRGALSATQLPEP